MIVEFAGKGGDGKHPAVVMSGGNRIPGLSVERLIIMSYQHEQRSLQRTPKNL